MNEHEARALADAIERAPGWMAEVWEGVNGKWYILAGREGDPLMHFVLRNQRDWERLCELLDDDS